MRSRLATFLLATLVALPFQATLASDAKEIDAKVDAALARLKEEVPGSETVLAEAKGVLVFAEVIKAGFVIAGEAWARCRAGEADPSKFGIFDMNGLWFIAGNVIRDAAALNNMEMLPWDSWGAMMGPGEPLQEDQLAFFDRLAALTCTPDACFAELRALYQDDRLRVTATVFNAILNRPETI